MNSHQKSAHRLTVPWRATCAVAVLVLLVSTTRLSACPTSPGPACKPAFSAIYVFGDSLSDTGRTAAVLEPAPPPATDWLNGRESNGPLWIEYLSPILGLKYSAENNFAWCGATSGRSNTNGAGLPGLLDQLDEFLGGLATSGVDPQALYIVFAGSNDFLSVLRGEQDPSIALPAAIENIVQTVATLRAVGAQHIVVIGVPDISLTPRVRVFPPETVAQVKAMCEGFETALRGTLDKYGLGATYVSTVTLLDDMVANPKRYGFLNVTDTAYTGNIGRARRFMFWSEVHPTTLTHAWLAWTVFDALDLERPHSNCRASLPWAWPYAFVTNAHR